MLVVQNWYPKHNNTSNIQKAYPFHTLEIPSPYLTGQNIQIHKSTKFVVILHEVTQQFSCLEFLLNVPQTVTKKMLLFLKQWLSIHHKDNYIMAYMFFFSFTLIQQNTYLVFFFCAHVHNIDWQFVWNNSNARSLFYREKIIITYSFFKIWPTIVSWTCDKPWLSLRTIFYQTDVLQELIICIFPKPELGVYHQYL